MLITLIRKEIKEMLAVSTIISMVVMASIFALTGQMISSSQEGAAEKAVVAVVNLDTGSYGSILTDALDTGANLVYAGDDVEKARAELTAEQGLALVTVPADFTSIIDSGNPAEVDILWLMKGAGIMDAVPQTLLQGLLDQADAAISTKLIETNSPLQATVVLNPSYSFNTTDYKGKTITGMTPAEIGAVLGSQTVVIPIAVMMLIIVASGSVIGSMGMEKENRTLETMLTMPVPRSYIIISKIVGSAAVGLLMGIVYMLGFYSYFNSLTGSGPDLAQFGLAINGLDYILIGLSMFAALMSGLCLALILGSFASNYRTAQTMIFPLVGLAMLPMMLTIFQDFDTMSPMMRIVLFLIPFSHPMMAMKALMLDNYALVLTGIAYCLAVTFILVVIATHIFTSDRVVTGMFGKRKGLLGLLSRRR